MNADTAAYAANALNQYVCITNPVNPVNPVQSLPAYDLDGNLLTNGPWAYTWDAENRLVSAVSNAVLRVVNTYDHLSRRIRKDVYARADPTCNLEPVTCHSFLYDGWNVIREAIAVGSGSTQSAITNYYTWGLDLSGTPQGAGGVGGLLAVTTIGSGTSYLLPLTYYPLYDVNGNVTACLDATGGVAVAFAYDGFGRTVSETWNLPPETCHLPYRFSTKYLDPETGLYYYGYRFYHPELGRWVSRDPIGEAGAVNIVVIGYNDLVNLIDITGLRVAGGIIDHGEVSRTTWDSLGEGPNTLGYTYAGFKAAETCVPCPDSGHKDCYRFTYAIPVEVFGNLYIKPGCADRKPKPTGCRTTFKHEHVHVNNTLRREYEYNRALEPLLDKCSSKACCENNVEFAKALNRYLTNEESRFDNELDVVDYPEIPEKIIAETKKRIRDRATRLFYEAMRILEERMKKACSVK